MVRIFFHFSIPIDFASVFILTKCGIGNHNLNLAKEQINILTFEDFNFFIYIISLPKIVWFSLVCCHEFYD